MTRRKIREAIYLLLFRVEYYPPEALEEQERLFMSDRDEPITVEDEERIRDRFEQILDHLPEIDDLIESETTGWDISRIAKTDLAIIRLALYEIKFDESVPTGVAINEAVELARKYGQDSAPSFVNGVLAKFA